MPADLPPPLLEFRAATLGHDGVPLLRDVDLTVRAGECVGVTGPNGAGKTTLVRAALGLVETASGTLRLGTTRLGYVPQRHTVAPVVPATVTEVVAVGRLPLAGPLRRWTPAVRRADRLAVDRALETVGLVDVARHPVARLSGGQQRRVLVARALASEPDLLLLDEPTAGVDTANQRVIAAVLQGLRDGGVGIVVVTHDPGSLEHVATRWLDVRGGRVAQGVPA